MNIFKKTKTDERRGGSAMRGGRRDGENENPYLSARRTWNDYTGSIIAARRLWQVVAIASLMIVLAAVGGLISVAKQSKFIPYIIEVDQVGKANAVAPVNPTTKADPRVLKAAVSEFIGDSRLVTPDIALQRKAIFRLYARLSPNDPATAKLNEWLNGSADASPFARAAKIMVTTEIKSVLPQTADTWQIDWVETTRDRQGGIVGKPENLRALITLYTAEPAAEITEEQLLMNPLGIYVRDFSWQKLL
jgi:type IV secretion system protein TrbF